MERRNWSLEALKELTYIDSLDADERADGLIRWNAKYLDEGQIENFDLEHTDLEKLLELFYKNINFLKIHKEKTRKDMVENRKVKKFLKP